MDSQGRHRILAVDDQPLERELLVERLGTEGFAVETAVDGLDAWDKLESDSNGFEVILLDRNMPRLTGLELLSRIKRHDDLRNVPVIFLTGMGDRAEIVEGVNAGCYYYLVKPYDGEILLSIVRAAVSDFTRYETFRSEVRKGMRGMSSLRRASFEIRTLTEAAELSTLLAYAFPEPETQVVGLSELLINAVEHGNLGITYEEKSRLNSDGSWQQEVNRRLALEENRRKRVRVEFERVDGEISVRILDEGTGFDWTRYLEIDPRRAFDTHGRGIAMANKFSFSRMEYCGCGNEVIAVVRSGETAGA